MLCFHCEILSKSMAFLYRNKCYGSLVVLTIILHGLHICEVSVPHAYKAYSSVCQTFHTQKKYSIPNARGSHALQLPFAERRVGLVYVFVFSNHCHAQNSAFSFLSSTVTMAVLEPWQIAAATFLSIVALLLIILMIAIFIVYLRKRKLWCFEDNPGMKKKDEEKLLYKYSGKEKVKKKKFVRKRVVAGDSQRRLLDPFAEKFSDPINMAEDFLDGENPDWDNPLFDVQAAKRKDAAITLQTWWRMIRLVS